MVFERNLNKLLIFNSADVNAVANGGTQPIHIACLLGHVYIVIYLIISGVNINAEITHAMFSKYVIDKKWCSDFGDKMTMLTYAIAIQQKSSLLAKSLMQFEQAKFEMEIHDNVKGKFVAILIKAGADIYATVNGDPDMLLINMAAYRGSSTMLKKLLPYSTSINESKALYYGTLPSGNPNEYFYPFQEFDNLERNRHIGKCELERRRIKRQIFILKDLINRLTFDLRVPEEEKN
ncbi:Protein of unknown function [Cotesia congregata]|uniref:Uncharacterized protein n=1 Tax=Cotesia congregata TaxID=51543 RepID=A0A8J2HJQ1_COTCN|nr:Protein of unknown function [Cotesia congregata]